MRVKDLKKGEWYALKVGLDRAGRVKYAGRRRFVRDRWQGFTSYQEQVNGHVVLNESGEELEIKTAASLLSTWADWLAKQALVDAALSEAAEMKREDRRVVERMMGPHAEVRESSAAGVLVWIPRDLVGFL